MKQIKKHTTYLDLLLKKHVYKEITAAQEKKLSLHLEKCEQCKKEEARLILQQRALENIKELTPSKNFEKNLFAKLDLPVEKQKNSDKIIQFVFGQSGRLRLAAAMMPIFFVAALLFRGYITPQFSRTMQPKKERVVSKIDKTKQHSPLHTEISKYFERNKLSDTKISIAISTQRYKKTIVRKRGGRSAKIMRKGAPSANFKKARSMDKTVARSGHNKTMPKKMNEKKVLKKDTFLAGKNRNLGNARLSDLGKSQNQQKKSEREKSAKNAQKDNSTLVKLSNFQNKNFNVAQRKDNINLKKEDSQRAQTIQRWRDEKIKEQDRITSLKKTKTEIKTVAKVTLTPTDQQHKYIRPHIEELRKIARRKLPRNTKISFHFAKKTAFQDRDKEAPSQQKPKSRSTLLVLWLIIELATRVLLILDLKKQQDKNMAKRISALLLGTIFLPVYIFIRKK